METVIKLDKSSLEKFCKSALTVISILITYNLYQIITEQNLDDHRTTLPIRLEPIAGSFITYFSAYIIPYIIWNFTSKDKNIYVWLQSFVPHKAQAQIIFLWCATGLNYQK